jgi:hypothetical protein
MFRIKHTTLLLILPLLLLTFTAFRGYATTQTAEQFVQSFYDWYFQSDSSNSIPEDNPDIYRFVSKPTIDGLHNDIQRGGYSDDVSYFTKVTEYDADEWHHSMIIHPAVILSDTAIVAVSFGRKEKTDIVLFLKKDHGNWQIIKADDTQTYP